MKSGLSSQFTCPFCGNGCNQKSKVQRHVQTAHPPSAPSAADLERVLKGVSYPKSKEELFEFVTQKVSVATPELIGLIDSLPERNYRDSAEVAIALGESKSGKRPRSQVAISKLEVPSRKEGREALKTRKISASRIAKVLKGINFPKSKRGIIMHISRQDDPQSEEIISILRRISNKKYQKLVQLEKEIGRIK